MREIKFRAWNSKKMFYPDSIMFGEDGSVSICFQHNNLPYGKKLFQIMEKLNSCNSQA